jgi:hypothetical protein
MVNCINAACFPTLHAALHVWDAGVARLRDMAVNKLCKQIHGTRAKQLELVPVKLCS